MYRFLPGTEHGLTYYQFSGSCPGLIPDSTGSVDPDQNWESDSRNGEEILCFEVLVVLFGGLAASPVVA
jgi:hypothetical protein